MTIEECYLPELVTKFLQEKSKTLLNVGDTLSYYVVFLV